MKAKENKETDLGWRLLLVFASFLYMANFNVDEFLKKISKTG